MRTDAEDKVVLADKGHREDEPRDQAQPQGTLLPDRHTFEYDPEGRNISSACPHQSSPVLGVVRAISLRF